jgi:uncharacterized protein
VPIKILSVSDKVEQHLLERTTSCLPEKPDIILACGDLPPEYLTQLRELYNTPLYYIEGNHDIRYRNSPPIGCINIHSKIITEQGLRIMGFSGSRWYNGGTNQYTEPEMKKIVRSLWFQLLKQKKVDIVISHAPPRFTHDREDPCHKGFRSFIPLLEKQKPTWFVHGHIHTLFNDPVDRISTVCETKVLNSYGFFFFETELVEEQTKRK